MAATVRKSSPMNPSGVQLARAIVPPGLQTRSSSAAACAWSGANMEPKTDVTASKEPSGKGSDSASPSKSSTERPSASARRRPLLEQRRHVVDADRGGAVPRRCDRGVAAAGGDVEHAPAGLQVGGVAEVLGDEHDAGGDDGEVAARPGRLLALLDGAEVGLGGFQNVSQGVSSCRAHGHPCEEIDATRAPATRHRGRLPISLPAGTYFGFGVQPTAT